MVLLRTDKAVFSIACDTISSKKAPAAQKLPVFEIPFHRHKMLNSVFMTKTLPRRAI
jgi:hypothetical protein